MNKITSVPDDVANLKNLQELRLSNNDISFVHPAIEALQELRTITLSSNRNLVTLPYESLLKLPNLKLLTLFTTKLGEATGVQRLETTETIHTYLQSLVNK
jgi:Leucine-rich repeat (LRR) protein